MCVVYVCTIELMVSFLFVFFYIFLFFFSVYCRFMLLTYAEQLYKNLFHKYSDTYIYINAKVNIFYHTEENKNR